MRKIMSRGLALVLSFVAVFSLLAPISTEKVEAATSNYNRITGSDVYSTSEKVVKAYKSEKKLSKLKAIVLATGKDYSDALSASYISSVAEAPILLTTNGRKATTVKFINSQVKKGGTVYIIGGTKALGSGFESSLKGNFNVVRLGGKDRYATNLLVLQEGDKVNKEKNRKVDRRVLVCSGKTYADAISAGATGHPILVVNDKLSTAQKNYLKSRSSSRYFILGGNKAVSNSVEKALKKYGDAARFYGNNRFETATVVAKKFFGARCKEDILVNGTNFAYGIMAGPLAQAKGCPILLNAEKEVAQAWNYAIKNKNKKCTVVGPKSSVETKTVAINKQLKKGWNNYKDGYLYIIDDWRMVKQEFYMEGGTVKPTTGGYISEKNNPVAWRRKDSESYGTAIVMHINSQMLDLVKDGKIVFSTPIVTGNEKDNNHTPRGTFKVNAKARNVWLVGSDYRSFVKYWVPFIGRMYGMHDADWRSKFGGDIYLTRGSRGCVNIPSEVMPKFYSMVSVGMKVIVKQK